MKINYFAKESLPIGTAVRHSSSNVAELVKNSVAGDLEQDYKRSYWQLIFLQSRANGCFYRFEDSPQVRWQWPKDTWFQERLSQKVAGIEFGAR